MPWIVQMIEAADDDGIATLLGTGDLHPCAGCHGLDLQGDGVSVPSLLGLRERMGFLDLYRIARDGRGRMPGLGGMLKGYERAAIAGFVYTAESEDTPANWKQKPGPKTFVNAGFQKLVDAEGLPGSKSPWGKLSAIDLAAGEIRWQIPFGDDPQVVAAGRSGLGAESYGGPILTASGLLFIAATPATYRADGRQFVVIAAGGGKLGQPSGSRYVAYALPGPDHAAAAAADQSPKSPIER